MFSYNIQIFSALAVFAISSCTHQPKRIEQSHTVALFGAPLDWNAYSEPAEKNVSLRLNKIVQEQGSFDPDCYYKPDPCGSSPNENTTSEVSNLSEEIKRETLGYFEVRTLKKGKLRRDFGGIAQGFVLNELRKAQQTDWSADFSGDIFLAPGSKTRVIGVADPRVPELDIAKIEMNSGWVMGGTSPKYGDKFRDPKTGELIRKSDFERLVLVAKPEFNGARLDAWETALMVGGKPLLDHLWGLKEYAGSWGYFYIGPGKQRICSPNLNCDLNGAGSVSKIKIVW